MTALGFDFGTTNTVLAHEAPKGTRSLVFDALGTQDDTMRTCLSFTQASPRSLHVEAGSAAIATFIEEPTDCRFLQSIKTFAASALFQKTSVYGQSFAFEDLMSAFLRRLLHYAGDAWPNDIDRIVTGRPVRFAGQNPNEQLAMERYNAALSRFGFPEIHFVYEPVAASFYFAENVASDAHVMVADFGGGTTDYSIIRFQRQAGHLTAEPVSFSGVDVAGDVFDYRIIDNVVAPMIGKGSHFKSFGKVLDMPTHYYTNFGRWSQLSIFKASKDFADLKNTVRFATEPEKLELFVQLIEDNEGYSLYQAVSQAKLALSSNDETEFYFPPLGQLSRTTIRRSDFETWIAPDLDRIKTAMNEALTRAKLQPGQIDKVFLTGGTSFVPAVRRIFHQTFDASKIEGGGELLSIAHGLALLGGRPDLERWSYRAFDLS